jgi:alpha-L-rhamnosidase
LVTHFLIFKQREIMYKRSSAIQFFQAICCVAFIISGLQGCEQKAEVKPGWPEIARETKPWTRWWWHGSALTKEGITAEMEAYQKAGLGGLEITPIYGVMGYENQFVEYLSPQWMELLLHTLREAERLDLGIDMATGTGWPFGGPWVKSEDASKNFNYKIYEVRAGEAFNEKIEFIQQPYLRAVGNQVHEVGNNFSTETMIGTATRREPVTRIDSKGIDIKQLIEPIGTNKNLQALALEQVQFKKPLSLQTLMAYSDAGTVINLTNEVDAFGKLNWITPAGNWKLYAVFEGWHGKMVERAGPGGEGFVIDHFSSAALQHYLYQFDSALSGKDLQSLRAFFNDSYEVDDARGTANWSPMLFDEFKKRRGYDLQEYLPALLGHDEEEKNKRVLCDYRETISEMLLDNFTQQWKTWAHSKAAIVRNQAHGSPANILDLYATVDIPEIEGVEPLRMKMASSAGNVTGKKLVSSESATWLNEHFESNLGDIKIALDRFMLNGINHIFYHGTAYSPPGEPWPGWLFYAAVHLNPRNSLWNDFDALNHYVSRCQSFLQNSTSDNDVLLYFPIYDRFSTPGNELIEHFDGIGKQFENTAFERGAKTMLENGYAFDYISDKQIGNVLWENEILKTEGNSQYKTVVIPHCQYIPVKTFEKIISLAEEGATMVAHEGLPVSVSGYSSLDKNKKSFSALMDKLGDPKQVLQGVNEIKVGKGRILIGDSLDLLLSYASIRKETMVNNGIDFIRKKESNSRSLYFITNRNNQSFSDWLPIEVSAASAVLYDPMTGEFGKAKTRKNDKKQLEVYVHLTGRQTLFIETYEDEPQIESFINYSTPSTPITLSGKWKISFANGGPELPASLDTDSLASWTTFGGETYEAFSGTAIYELSFDKPAQTAAGWIIDLGVVKESAEVLLNGNKIGTLIGPVYQIYMEPSMLKEKNMLEVRVSNLMANRIADMDRKKIIWRKFYNVNFPARKSENRKNGLFDATGWVPRESGLIGPVTISSLQTD